MEISSIDDLKKSLYQWEQVNDGYNSEWRLVLISTGLIVGEVSGSNFDPCSSWSAHLTPPNHKVLGSYTTCDLAKAAVLSKVCNIKDA